MTENKNTQLTIKLDTTGKIQVIGALIASIVLLLGTGFIVGDSMAMDRQHFQEVMDNSTIDTLEMANQSFSDGNTEIGKQHTESAMTMMWANLQVTEDQKYRQMWGTLGFQCVEGGQNRVCQDLVQQSIDILKGQDNQSSKQNPTNA